MKLISRSRVSGIHLPRIGQGRQNGRLLADGKARLNRPGFPRHSVAVEIVVLELYRGNVVCIDVTTFGIVEPLGELPRGRDGFCGGYAPA